MIRISLGGLEVYIAADVVEQVREWAAYCRCGQPGPNIADTMLAAIGDPPHDYGREAAGEQYDLERKIARQNEVIRQKSAQISRLQETIEKLREGDHESPSPESNEAAGEQNNGR